MSRFEGRVAVVTGASRGIGLAIAERIVAEGGRVCLTGGNQERLGGPGVAAAHAGSADDEEHQDTVIKQVLDAVEFLRALRGAKAALVPDRLTVTRPGPEPVVVEVAIDVETFASAWRKILRDKTKPGMLVRRHLEVCVFSYLAAELRTRSTGT